MLTALIAGRLLEALLILLVPLMVCVSGGEPVMCTPQRAHRDLCVGTPVR